MASFKGETLIYEQPKYDCSLASTLRRRPQITTTANSTTIAEPCPDYGNGSYKKRCMLQREKAEFLDAGASGDSSKKGSTVMGDEDHLAFIEMLCANPDFYGESGDYCFNFGRNENVNYGGFSKSFENAVDPNYKIFLKNARDDYCFNFGRKENVNCTGFKKPFKNVLDPYYKIFLENARADGSSYGFETTKEDGTKVFLKYQGMEEDVGKDVEDQLDGTPSEERMNDSAVKKTPNMEPLDDGFEKSSGHGSEKTSLEAPHWFLSHCKPGTISSSDQSYLKLLDRIWVDGDSFTYKNGDSIVKYEDDYKVMIGSQELGGNAISSGTGMKFRPNADQERISDTAVKYEDDDSVVTGSKELGGNVISSGSGVKFEPDANQKKPSKMAVHRDDTHSDSDSLHILDEKFANFYYGNGKSFKKNLRQILEKQFDKKEFREKYLEATRRKPMEKLRHMRGREVSYKLNCNRLSYLGRHPDLANMLEDALLEPGRRRALVLLRCLFYYYEHVSHEGSFPPWKNPKGWLHNVLCRCPDPDENCPMKKYHMCYGERRSFSPRYR